MLQATCFGTSVETGVDFKDDSGFQGRTDSREDEKEGNYAECRTVQLEMTAKCVDHFSVCMFARA